MHSKFYIKTNCLVFLFIIILIHISCHKKVDDKLTAEEKLKKYNELIAEYSDDLRLFKERAFVYDELCKKDSALIDIKRCIDGGMKDHKLYNLKGKILYKRQDYLNAIASYTQGIELRDEDTVALLYRGSCYEALRNYDDAINDYRRLLDLANNNKYSHSYGINGLIAFCHIFKGEYEKAIERYKQGIRSLNCSEEDSTCNYLKSKSYRDIAVLYSICNDYRAALENIENAVYYMNRSSNAGSDVYYHRALILLKLQNVKQAKQDMEKVYDQFGIENRFFYLTKFYLSLYYADIGNIIDSKKSFKEAVDKGFEYFDLIPIELKYNHLLSEARKLKNRFKKQKMIKRIISEDRICNGEEYDVALLDRREAIIYSKNHRTEYSKLIQLCREYGYFGECK